MVLPAVGNRGQTTVSDDLRLLENRNRGLSPVSRTTLWRWT